MRRRPGPQRGAAAPRCVLAIAFAAFGLAPAAPSVSAAADPLPRSIAEARPAAAAGKIRALVITRARSPVLRALRRQLGSRLEIHSTLGRGISPRPRRYHLLIADGDQLSPRQLARRPEVGPFLAAGRWVLALDVRPGHQSIGLSRHTGFSALPASGRRARRTGLLIARGRVGATHRIFMVDLPRLGPYGPNPRRSQGARVRRRGARDAARLVGAAVRARVADVLAQSAPHDDDGLPPEVQHVAWTFVQSASQNPPNGSWTGDRQGIGVPTPGDQESSWTVNHDFDVYLDNGAGRPQGNFQVLTYNVSGEFNPAAGGIFFHMNDPFKIGFTQDKILEKAWWTGGVTVGLRPLDTGTDQALIWQANDPATPNEENSYTSGDDFEIGFSSEEGPNASFTVNNERENTVPDWGVQSQTQRNNLVWQFTARSPCDTRQQISGQNGCFAENFGQNGTPNQPNALSLGQFQFATSARWRTTGVLSGDAANLTFFGGVGMSVVDTYCQLWLLYWCDPQRNGQPFDTGPLATAGPTMFTIDVSAVNPIPVQSLTLSPNPANGSAQQPVTGTLTLQRAAPMDLTVLISSNSQNAVVGPPIQGGPGSSTTVEIPKGQTTGTFAVQTNDNGLRAGAHTTAAITAFYTTPTVAQLQVNRP
jgi:hypothetical protein